LSTGDSAIRRISHARAWPILAAPLRELSYMLAVQLAAVGTAAFLLSRETFSTRNSLLTVFILVIAVVFEEAVRRAARLQMRLSADLKRDMTSVWTVACAVALPAGYGAVVIAILTTYLWFRQRRPNGHPLHRGLFNVAAIALSTVAAALVVHRWQESWSTLPWTLGLAVTIVAAMAVYTVVNRLFASVGLMTMRVPLKALRGTREDNLIEIATLCLGGLVAIAALYEPWLCVLALAPMITLQRGALVRELETAATIDGKTNLLNAVAWEHLAQRELARGEREKYDVAVLIIDIDRFKLVNDQYGHLVGDRVLQHIGKVLTAGVREYDTVGRFGGEEFVAVLPNAGDADALVVAERLRSRVNELRIAALLEGPAPEGAAEHALAISVGVSCTRYDGREVSDLLVAADAALYRAKAGGRNRVVLAKRDGGTAYAPVHPV